MVPLFVGILAFVWSKRSLCADNFYGQQLVVFGTSISDNGNGVHPYMAQTLKLTDQVNNFYSISWTPNRIAFTKLPMSAANIAMSPSLILDIKI